jgi:hypothetical protein
MVICNEPTCLEWREQALQGLRFPDHQNHVAQVWVSLSPLLQPNLADKISEVDGSDLSLDMLERIQAGKQLMMGVRIRTISLHDCAIFSREKVDKT